jgi:hypothetical protein
MSKRLRRNHAPVFKAKVALDALKDEPCHIYATDFQTVVDFS